MVFLHSHGSARRGGAHLKTYGSDAIRVMSRTPTGSRAISVASDQDGRRDRHEAGHRKDRHDPRARGVPTPDEAMEDGHCGLPTEELVPLAEKLLEVPQQLIRTALELELHDGTVIADRVGETPCVFLTGLLRAERTIAERLLRLANGRLPWPWIDPAKALPWVEGRIGLALADSQVAAIRLALMSKVLVMTGGPGVGKTTIVNAILRILAAKGTTSAAPDRPRRQTHD